MNTLDKLRSRKDQLFGFLAIALVALFGASAQAQVVGDDPLGDLTDGLTTTFGAIMAVVIPIMLAVTGIIWFLKFRNKA